MRLVMFMAFSVFTVSLNCIAMQSSLKTASRIITQTPCPFINLALIRMIKAGEITDAKVVSAKKLVDFSVLHFGIDRTLMETLANGRADENGNIHSADLLDPSQFPAHRGSFARVDANTAEEFAVVDEARLNVLMNDIRFSTVREIDGKTDKYISYKQLKEYQTEYCWSQSDMSCIKDKIPAKVEAHLIWAFFGAYRVKDNDGTELIPLELIDNIFRNSTAPEYFQINTVDPATRCSVAWCVLTE